jgi:hypothetical protein
MAIINSYPNITPKAEDLLLISDTSVEGNPTKTATINNVLALLPSGGGGGGIANIQSSNSNFLSVTNPDGPLVTLNIKTGFVASGGNTLATTGDIYTFTNTSITNAINNLGALTSFACDISNIPAFTSNVTTSTAGATVLTISRTGGQAGEFLDYTGNWSAPSVQGMTFWGIGGDVGSGVEVKDKETVDFLGGTKITTDIRQINQGRYQLTIFHDTQTQTNATPSTTLTNGGTFTALSENVAVDGTGHVTGQVLRTYTLPTNAINSIGVDAPIQNTGTASDPVIDIEEADGTTDGYLSSTYWTIFNNKQDALTLTTTGTSGAATLVGSTLNIPIYPSGTGGGTVTGVGLDVSAFNALSVTTQGGGPNPITGSDTFVVGINGPTSASEYLDGSGNWSTPAGTGTDLTPALGTTSVEIQSNTGTNATIPEVNITNNTAGVMTPAQKTRLNSLQVTSNAVALGISPPNTSSNTLTMPWGGTSSQVVLGDGSLTTLPTQFSWTLDGDTGSNPVSDGATIEIVGGIGISTAVSGNTLTVTNTSSGTVQSIDVQDGNFTTGSTSTGSAITTSGTISFDLSAVGNANQTSFLRGDDKWSVLKNGKGINQISFSTASPDYGTVLSVEYIGSNNVVKSANTPGGGWDLTDTVIINQASSSVVYEATLQSIKDAVVTSPVPVAFSVDASANIQNSGNIADNPQGFGPITTAIGSSNTGIDISFGKTQLDTNYMINFTVEQPLVFGGQDYAVSAWVPSATKTRSGFTILYDKGGTGTGLGTPELTNFQLYR